MINRLFRTAFPLTAAIALAGGVASADPTTPLGQWMKANMGTALAGQDFGALKSNFELLASKPPPSGDYGQWASFARTGSGAAAKSDAAAVKAACKQCHDTYKAKYRKDFPNRAFP